MVAPTIAHAEKDLLVDLHPARIFRGFPAAVLVGFLRDDPNPLLLVVGRLPQRLVLARAHAVPRGFAVASRCVQAFAPVLTWISRAP